MKPHLIIFLYCCAFVSPLSASSSSSSASGSAQASTVKKTAKKGSKVPVGGLAVFEGPRTQNSALWDTNLEGMILGFLSDDFQEEPAYVINTNLGLIHGMVLSKNGQQLFCTADRGYIEVREKGKDEIFPDMPTYTINTGDFKTSIALSADGQWLFAVDYNGEIAVYNKKDDRFPDTPLYEMNTRHFISSRSLIVSEDGQQLIMAAGEGSGRDGTIYVYAKGKGGRFSDIPMYTIPTNYQIGDMALSTDGKWLFFANENKIEVRKKGEDGRFSNRPTYIINSSQNPRFIQGIALSNDGQQLFSGGINLTTGETKIRVREKEDNGKFSNEPTYEINTASSNRLCIALSADGLYLFSTVGTGKIQVRINERAQLLGTNWLQSIKLKVDEWSKKEFKRRKQEKEKHIKLQPLKTSGIAAVSIGQYNIWLKSLRHKLSQEQTSKEYKQELFETFIRIEGAHAYAAINNV